MKPLLLKYIERLLALTILCSLGPFFVWETFLGGIGYTFYKCLQVLTLITLIALVCLFHTNFTKFCASVCMILLFLFLSQCTGVISETYLPLMPGNIITFTLFALFVVTEEGCLAGSFDSLKTILAVIYVYTLIIFILVVVGVSLPSSNIETERTAISGQYHINYFGCLFLSGWHVSRLDRFASVFVEPGVVGTISALILAASDFDLKSDKRNVVFLVSGIFSLSFAFFCIVAICLMFKSFKKGLYKIAILLIILAVSYVVFVSIKFENESVLEFQSRIMLSEDAMKRNSRLTEDAEKEYDEFLQGDVLPLLFGHGKAITDRITGESVWSLSASYRRDVYYFGVVGFGLYLLWVIVFPYRCYKTLDPEINYNMIVYIVVFLLSIYQRPNITVLYFLYFLLAGCVYLKRRSRNQLISKS